MPDERTQKPPLSLEAIAQLAKETTLRDGYHLPTLIVDGEHQAIATQIERFAPTHEGRAQQLFVLGMILAERGEPSVLQQVFLITEAWMSMATQEHSPHVPPSQDPQRKEILAVSRLRVHPPHTDMVVFEMKRDSTGKLMSLENLDRQIAAENGVSAESPLLEAFAIGFLGSALKPND